MPAIGKRRYRPVRLMALPVSTDADNTPAMRGTNASPELVAEAPDATCRRSGRKLIAPNIAVPRMKLTALATRKTWLRNNRRGTTGSGARRSTTANTASSNAPAAARPMMTRDPQGYSVPPQVVSSTSAPTPPASNMAPP